MKRVAFWWGLALTLGLMLMFVGASSWAADYDPDNPPTVTGCVIRFYSTGPQIHENSAHLCTGANSVEVTEDGDLLITSDWQGPVVSIAVNPDESLVLLGILAGASDGLGKTKIKFWSAETGQRVRADSPTLVCQWCNLWITWVHGGAAPVGDQLSSR